MLQSSSRRTPAAEMSDPAKDPEVEQEEEEDEQEFDPAEEVRPLKEAETQGGCMGAVCAFRPWQGHGGDLSRSRAHLSG